MSVSVEAKIKATQDLSISPMSGEVLTELRCLYSSAPDGRCWCVAWEVPTWKGWAQRTGDENRPLREALWSKGEYNGYLFYENHVPVGWCKVGPTKAWPKFCEESGVPQSDTVYAFTCFRLKPKYQGKGYLHVFLRKIIQDLQAKGIKKFVAFPRKDEGVIEPGSTALWMGPLSVFAKAGFQIIRTIGQRHVVEFETSALSIATNSGDRELQ